MQLILDIVKSGKSRPAFKNLKFDKCDGVIGRSSEADYQLNDFENYISGKHLYIDYKYGQYYLRDESTNGTFLKHPYKKLPKGMPYQVNASDVYIIGDHELQVRFSDNEYTDDFIVGSFSNEPEPLEAIEELIPDDDFLYEDVRDSLRETSDEKTTSKEDVLDLLDGSAKASVLLEMDEGESHEIADVHENLFEQHIDVPTFAKQELHKKPPITIHDQQLADAIRILEEKLGLEIIALEKKERELLMNEIADVLINSMDGLKNSLYIKEQTTRDLRITPVGSDDTTANNPLKLGISALKLLQDERMEGRSGFMKLSSGVARSFAQIDAHTIALHGASKNLMNTALSQFAPKNLEHKFDAIGALRGPVPRSYLMWKAYTQMFDKLNNDPDSGVEILSPHFAKEYEKLAFSVGLVSADTLQKR